MTLANSNNGAYHEEGIILSNFHILTDVNSHDNNGRHFLSLFADKPL